MNICIAGSVNTGKTTLVNALLNRKADIHPHYRAVIVQDRREIKADRFSKKNYLMARVERARNESNGSISRYMYEFSDALEDALRLNGDFLVWGEVRDGLSAFGLTMALNRGTRGLLTTTHANSALDALFRMEDLLRLNGKPPVCRMIAHVFDVVCFMERDRDTGRRRMTELAESKDVDGNDNYLLDFVPAREAA